MSADVMQWICIKLSKLLGADADENVARYLLSIETPHELEEYLGEILDTSLSDNKSFVQELIRRRWATSKDAFPSLSQHQQSNGVALLKKHNLERENGVKDVIAKRPDYEKQTATDDQTYQKRPAKDRTKQSKTKFVPLFSPEGHDRTVALIPGRHVCECQAAKHALINNCLGCGRVVCEQEGAGPCFYCQTLVCNKSDQEILLHNSKKSDRLRDHLMKQTIKNGVYTSEQTTDNDRSLSAAVAFKDRLLEYDKTSAKRTHVVDDESDYFSTDTNQWLRPKERDALQRKKDELHSQRHASRRDYKVTFDFAGRRVVEEQNSVDSHQVVDCGGDELVADSVPEINPDDFSFDLVNPTLRVPAPKFTVPEGDKATRNSYAIATRGVKNVRLQDSDLQVMSDEGLALSMHQPWASLLVTGIKKHEGRTWYTTHRGVLWIASTVKKPDPQDIDNMESFYRKYYNDDHVEFPSAYPTGCLLGCVTVSDCVALEDYTQQYPDGESESPYVFICENPQELQVKFPMQGKHKIYKLDKHLHQAAKKGIQHQ